MVKLFSIKMEEMSQDVLDMGLLTEVGYHEQLLARENESVSVPAGSDSDGVNTEPVINIIDAIHENTPATDTIIKINE